MTLRRWAGANVPRAVTAFLLVAPVSAALASVGGVGSMAVPGLIDFKNVYSKWDAVFAEKGWGTIYLGNHDQPRMTTRWGNDAPEWRE